MTLFDQLNQRYFAGVLQRPHIGWSTRGWRRQFGCYDPGPNQILLNRRMDRPGIPQFVVEYVLYHEMLHVKHPTRRSGCSLISHSPEFRAEEKRFDSLHRRANFWTGWRAEACSYFFFSLSTSWLNFSIFLRTLSPSSA